jgi:hypothetical protein
MENLNVGHDNNQLKLLVQKMEINAHPYGCVKIHIEKYSLDDVINQLVEEYGKEKLIAKINEP